MKGHHTGNDSEVDEEHSVPGEAKKILIPEKKPALIKGAGGGTIEKIQNKNGGGSPAERIRGTAAVILALAVHLKLESGGILVLGNDAVDLLEIGKDHIADDTVLDGGHGVAVL